MTCNLGKMFYRFHFCKTFSISFFIQENYTLLFRFLSFSGKSHSSSQCFG
ncbi:hypothetical protein V6Z12_A05G379400 [Gossypium hirsutum]